MSANEERELQQQLAPLGLPDDLTEVALGHGPAPDAAAAARIKQRALALAVGAPIEVRTLPTKRTTRRWPRAVAAVAALIALTVVAAPGPRQALARILQFVPGFGAWDTAEVKLSAATRVAAERGDQRVEVLGLLVDDKSISVHLTASRVPLGFDRVFVEDAKGRRVPLTRGDFSHGSRDYEGWFSSATAFEPVGSRVTVVVSGTPDWRLEVDLVPGESLTPVAQLPAASAQGYTFGGRIQPLEDRLAVDILVQAAPKGAQVTHLGVSGPPTLADTPRGWQSELRPKHTAVTALFAFDADLPPAGVDQVTLTIPAIWVRESGEATFEVPVANSPVNHTLTIGQRTLQITRTELTDEGLKVFVKPGEGLYRWVELDMNGEISSWQSKHNEQTDGMEWFLFPVPAGAKSVTLTIKWPEVVVQGPWTLTLPIQR